MYLLGGNLPKIKDNHNRKGIFLQTMDMLFLRLSMVYKRKVRIQITIYEHRFCNDSISVVNNDIFYFLKRYGECCNCRAALKQNVV